MVCIESLISSISHLLGSITRNFKKWIQETVFFIVSNARERL